MGVITAAYASTSIRVQTTWLCAARQREIKTIDTNVAPQHELLLSTISFLCSSTKLSVLHLSP